MTIRNKQSTRKRTEFCKYNTTIKKTKDKL